MRRLLTVFNSVLFAILTAASTAGANDLADFNNSDEGELFSIEGSNTIGEHLARAWAEGYLSAKGAENISTRAGVKPNEHQVIGVHGGQQVWISIKAHGSSTGFEGLALGSADLAMSSRPIKSGERQALAHLGDLASATGEHVVAIDGLAVIVHPDNPITSLSVAQVRALFSGAARNWRDVGGVDAPVTLYARDDKSGTFDTFNSMVLNGQPLARGTRRFESTDLLSGMVAADPHAIGFVGLAGVGSARALAIQDGTTTAMLPTRLAVATEDYPLSRRLYLYSPPNIVNVSVHEFLQYVQSKRGQAAVDTIGFVAQTPVVTPQVVTEGPSVYLQLAQVAERLSINFRFQAGQAELDYKGQRDAQRLAEYMRDNPGARLQLVGFSDGNDVEDSTAELLSKLRASRVKVELFHHRVLTAPVVGYGAARKVASNPLWSERNDRVEVWVYPAAAAPTINALQAPAAIGHDALASWSHIKKASSATAALAK